MTNPFESIENRLSSIENLLHNLKNENNDKSTRPDIDRWFDILDLCNYHPEKPARATVYTWVRERRIPHHKKGKKLIFLKSEIDAWIKEGRKKTSTEIHEKASSHFRTPRRQKRNNKSS